MPQPVDLPPSAESISDDTTPGAPVTITVLRRRYLRSAGLGAALAFVLFIVILQGGRGGLFDRDLVGNFYDGQARAILDGHLNVPPSVPGFEGFVIGEETHIYQGLTPVIPRLPVVAVTSAFDGRLTGLSMICAYGVLLFYMVIAGWRARLSIRGVAPLGRAEAVLSGFAAFGLGSGLVGFLASKSWVYHEAALWGVSLSLASLVHLVIWLESQQRTSGLEPTSRQNSTSTHRVMAHLVAATLFAGLAFNTRISIGAGPLLALSITAILVITGRIGPTSSGEHSTRERSSRERSTRERIVAVVVAVAGSAVFVGGYAAVNHARFGSMFGVPLDKQRLVENDPMRMKALNANGGSLFGVQYAPSVALQMLRPDAISGRSVFPYLGFPGSRPTVVGSAVFSERDWSTSIPNATPLGFLAGVIGVVVLVTPRRMLGSSDPEDDDSRDARGAMVLWRIPVLGAAAAGATILVFGFMAQRYAADFYPFVALTALVGLNWAAKQLLDGNKSDKVLSGSPTFRWSVAGGVVALSLAGPWVTSAVALQYQREIAPSYLSVDRAGWLGLQMALPGSVDVMAVDELESLGDNGPMGTVAIVADCEAMYRGSDRRWFMLESGGRINGNDTGIRIKVRSDRPWSSFAQPLVLARGDDQSDPAELRLVSLSDSAQLELTHGYNEARPFKVKDGPEGFELDLDLSADQLIDEVIVTRHDVLEELIVSYGTVSENRWTPAEDLPAGVTVEISRLDTPLCDELVDEGY